MSQNPSSFNSEGRGLSHDEAEELLSLRQDSPIDPIDNRVLLSHLRGCASCRAFAIQLEIIARELESLPVLPASSTVRREVHERIQAPQPLWSRLTTNATGGGMRAVPAALSALVVLVALATFVMIRLGESDPGGGVATDPGAIDAPSEQALLLSPSPSSTVDSQAELMQELPDDPTPTARVVTTNTPSPESTETPTGSELVPRDAGINGVAPEAEPSATATTAPSQTPPSEATQPAGEDEPDAPQAPGSTATSGPQLAQVTPTPDVAAIVAAALAPQETPGVDETPDSPGIGAGGEEDEPERTAASTSTATSGPQLAQVTQTPDVDAIVAAAFFPPETPEVDQTQESSGISASGDPEPTSTSTEVQESTGTPTLTPTTPPTETTAPEPTATATATPQPTFTSAPELTATSIPEPTSTPTLEPTATLEPTSTATVEPTATPTATPAEEPFVGQPTIAPMQGSEAEQQEPTEVSTQAEAAVSEEASSPPIQPAAGSAGEAGLEEEPTQEILPPEEATEIPATEQTTEDAVGGAAGGILDQADVVANLGGGVAAPTGRLEFGPAINWYIVTLGDGSMAVADTSGSLLASLGAGVYPIWSPQGVVLLYADVSGAYPSIATWDAQSGLVYSGGAAAERTVADLPAGWLGSRYYYQRTFPDSPGEIEIHSANWDGSDDQLLWTGSDVYPVTARPVATGAGITIATSSGWMIIGPDGSAAHVGGVAFGSVGAPIVSIGGSLIAYSADGAVYVAGINDPGSPLGPGILYSGGFGAGYAFATSGEQLVVSSAGGLALYTIYGEPLGSADSSISIAAPYWIEDSIYFLEVGDATTLRVISASSIFA